jgi:effector-binding domain-containing protein
VELQSGSMEQLEANVARLVKWIDLSHGKTVTGNSCIREVMDIIRYLNRLTSEMYIMISLQTWQPPHNEL